jgi:hypothetical protein
VKAKADPALATTTTADLGFLALGVGRLADALQRNQG